LSSTLVKILLHDTFQCAKSHTIMLCKCHHTFCQSVSLSHFKLGMLLTSVSPLRIALGFLDIK
jgi:hypothetical protein